jgi:hypothetical protein
MNIEEFVAAYIEAAMWSTCISSDESDPDYDKPLESKYDASNIAPESLVSIYTDCAKFIASNATDLAEYPGRRQWSAAKCAGYDFWLTRNGHGVGFWDRGLGALGDRLSEASRKFGESDMYVGDDGRMYV